MYNIRFTNILQKWGITALWEIKNGNIWQIVTLGFPWRNDLSVFSTSGLGLGGNISAKVVENTATFAKMFKQLLSHSNKSLSLCYEKVRFCSGDIKLSNNVK